MPFHRKGAPRFQRGGARAVTEQREGQLQAVKSAIASNLQLVWILFSIEASKLV